LDGIDGIIVGPNDLSASMGHIGRTAHPDMFPIYDKIGNVLKESGKLFGVSVGYDETTIEQWLDRGANMIFVGHDVGYVHDGAHSTSSRLDKIINSRINKFNHTII
ncbi:MAG: aldolase/citrate lyase family protein, partial [Bacillota bacterium]|nr:aldolase/citrate lyase family protein [Bacillota bacterium]